MIARPSLVALALLTALTASAGAQRSSVKAEDAWVRQPAPSRDVTAAYLVLVNDSDDAVRVVAGESTMAKTVELHEMAMDGSMMRMRQVKEIAVPPKSRVELKPGGLHVMLFGLKQPLKAGDLVPLTLTLADGNKLSFEATVRPPDSSK